MHRPLEQKRTGETARRFGEHEYATRSWPHERRFTIKAEVTVIHGRAPAWSDPCAVDNFIRPAPFGHIARKEVKERLAPWGGKTAMTGV